MRQFEDNVYEYKFNITNLKKRAIVIKSKALAISRAVLVSDFFE